MHKMELKQQPEQLNRRLWLSLATATFVASAQPNLASAADPPLIEVHEGFKLVRQEVRGGGIGGGEL
jgi:hypothetical protein